MLWNKVAKKIINRFEKFIEYMDLAFYAWLRDMKLQSTYPYSPKSVHEERGTPV